MHGVLGITQKFQKPAVNKVFLLLFVHKKKCCPYERSGHYESRDLASGPLPFGGRQHLCLPGFRRGLRAHLRRGSVIYVTAAIAVLLFVYLGTALVRPEWF